MTLLDIKMNFPDNLKHAVVNDARDWSLNRTDALIFSVIVGWNDALDDICEIHSFDKTKLSKMRNQYLECINNTKTTQHDYPTDLESQFDDMMDFRS